MNQHFKEITIKEMCQIMEISVPAHMTSKEDLAISHIALIANHIKKGSAYFVCVDEPNIPKIMKQAMNNKASVIFVPEKAFKSSGLSEKLYPVIFTDNWLDQLGKLFSTIRCSYPAKTVAITGTVGKTTTKEFISTILQNEQKIFCNNGNRNSFLTVAKHITEELTDDIDTYIQEIGAGTPLSIEKSGSMLRPDYFVLLNVKNHHLNTYKTFDALFHDKVSVDKYMPEHGVIIANFDDERIASHPFIHPVISFGINTKKNVTYRAVNITEENGKLSFDIVSETETVSICIDILGKHNVYNALAAYVLVKQLSIPVEKIAENLRHYHTSGIRQNYQNIGGYHLYVDCYNVAFDSIQAGIHTITDFTLKPDARRIAVIGGENKLGSDAPSLSYRFGQSLAASEIDTFLCYGQTDRSKESLDKYGDAKSICDGINQSGQKNAEFISDPELLIKRLKEITKRGDIIFFKGIYLLDMPHIIDSVFGSSFTAKSEHYLKDAQYIDSGSLRFKKLPVGNEVELFKSLKKRIFLRIPDSVNGHPVYRVSEAAFANRRIFSIFWGKNILHIAADAFKNCVYLKKLHIPSNIMVIEKRAFLNCSKLRKVIMDKGVRHIGRFAFKNCVNLKYVSIPESVGFIDETAFAECPDLIIHCVKGSYAETFALKNNIQYVTDL